MRITKQFTLEKARRQMLWKAEEGGLPGCAPVGYRNRRQGKLAWIEADLVKAPLVVKIYTLAATGEYTVRELVALAQEIGLESRNGNPIGISSLWGILTNPFYYGEVLYKGRFYPGSHEPLISKELWREAQLAISSRRRNAPKPWIVPDRYIVHSQPNKK